MATGFLAVCLLAGLLVPGMRAAAGSLELDRRLAASSETG